MLPHTHDSPSQTAAETATGIPALALLRQCGLLPNPPPACNILDSACGQGIVTQTLLEHLDAAQKRHVSIICGDKDKTMWTLTQDRIRERGWHDHAHAMLMDAENASLLADGEFTHVLMNFGPQLMTNPLAMLRETHRLLQAHGTAGFTSWTRAGWLPSMREVFPDFMPSVTPLSQPTWTVPDNITTVLTETGFRDVTVTALDFVTREMKLDAYLELASLLLPKLLGDDEPDNRQKYEEHMRGKYERGEMEMDWQALIVSAVKA